MEQLTLGFIGCGSMGTAIIKGIVKNNTVDSDKIWVYDVQADKAEALQKNISVNVASDYSELCEKSDCIFLVVKPADLSHLLSRINNLLHENHLIVSVIAGISTGFIDSALGNNHRVIRLMPNTPCLIGEGVIAISPGKYARESDPDMVEELVASLGLTIKTEDKYMDAITALSGSGPAYVLLFLESLVEGGVNIGLDRQTAENLATQTLMGTAKMAQSSGNNYVELKNSVASPGGTTIAALKSLETNAFRGTVMDAVAAAFQRAKSLKAD